MKINHKLMLQEMSRIRANNGASLFWITDIKARADRVQYMQDNRLIKRIPNDTFPWCHFEVLAMTCGHLPDQLYSSDEGTCFCKECARLAGHNIT